jgi:hypothetical protein
MLVQKFLELIGIKIGQHPITRHKSWNISLVGKLFHFRVRFSIPADINDIEPVSFLGEILLRVNAPRAPFATVKLQFHGDCGNKQERCSPSIAKARRFPSRRCEQSRSSACHAEAFAKAGERRQFYEEVCDAAAADEA